MGKREHYEPGTFSWADLATTDAAGAKAFYGELFGWVGEDMPAGENATYTMMNLDGDYVCGLYETEAERHDQGVPSYWFSYVTVESADAAAERARELGGAVYGDAFDVLDSGRMAIIEDPTGATLGAWEPRAHAGAGRVNDVGCMGWNELHTRDYEAASAFYRGLFGWEPEVIKQDGQTVYVTIKNAGRQNGGIMPMSGENGGAPSAWVPYFTVPSRDAAVQKTKDLGGALVVGPLDLPAGRIAILRDPQGAVFAIFEGETDE